MSLSVPIDTREITITPVFKHITVENVERSEKEGYAVMETQEVVEVRFAGSKLYSPVFPVDAMWKREGNRVITYAERWPEEYRRFLEGDTQVARGTPLEMLKPFGISDAQLSLCRALRVYSIEALDNLEGGNLKNLGMNANSLKDMARQFMAQRNGGGSTNAEIEALKAQIEALKQMIPPKDSTPAQIEAAVAAADKAFEDMSDAELKAFIKERSGQAPRGTPSHDWLVSAAKELAA